MPQSLSAVYIHLVFSTKDRRPFLRDKDIRIELHAYLGGISKKLDCPPIEIGGVEDHIHILARFGRTVTQADWVKELKRVSNTWLKTKGLENRDFESKWIFRFLRQPIQSGRGAQLHSIAGGTSPAPEFSGRTAPDSAKTQSGVG
jgi:REP element-mobilizing transposase RayT